MMAEVQKQPEASTSAPPRPLCTICNHRYSIYTCPRCSLRTCSLPCSNTHKSASGCTGERDKVAYVPMNKYGWGTMMNDYVLLEDVGRRVGDWGKEIVKGGFNQTAAPSNDGRGRGGMRGRGDRGGRGRGRGGGGGKTKRDILKMQLEIRDINMDLLPVGMERRKLNQSNWDFKSQTALLTIEYKFHPPPDPANPSSPVREPPYTMLTHRNTLNTPLLSLLQSHINDRVTSRKDKEKENSKDKSFPSWVQPLVCPHPDDPESFTPPQCVMTAQLDPGSLTLSGTRPKAGYYRFDPAQILGVLLRNTHFVEYPTIEIWEEFRGVVVDEQGAVTQQPAEDQEEEQRRRRVKRRKLDIKAGKQAISGLLGGYGSDDDEEDNADSAEEGKPKGGGGLALLGGYEGSEDEDDGLGDEDAEGDTDDEVEMDPAALLELVKQVQSRSQWGSTGVEEDAVDWGESEEDEPN